MKKLVSVLVALMLCLTAVAAAESVPSKDTDDMSSVTVPSKDTDDMTNVNIPSKDTTGMTDISYLTEDMLVITVAKEKAEGHYAACENELNKLMESASVAAYFGEVKNAAGEVVSLTEALGTDTLKVYEFTTMIVKNYKEEYGDVAVNMQFATPYKSGEKVLVMIGLITVAEDGNQSVEWTVSEGVVAVDGSIDVVLDSAIMTSVQNGTAIMSVISK